MAVICDGIGGLSKGEQASGYVVRQMANWFMSVGYNKKGKKQHRNLQQFLFQIHEELKEYGKEKGISLGTTVTIILIDGKKLHWFHCGDCRLYLFRNRKVRKLTTDHHEKDGTLNRAIGVGEWDILESGKVNIRNEDRFLLCSDGLYKNLTIKELQRWFDKTILSDGQAERMLRQLFQKKISEGERDNLSALYFGYIKREEGEVI